MESINLVPSTTFSKRAGARFTRWLRRAAKNWQCYVLILPAVAAVFIFHYIPIYGVQVAFKDFKASLGFWGSRGSAWNISGDFSPIRISGKF